MRIKTTRVLLLALAVAALAMGAGTLSATEPQPPFAVLHEEADSSDALPQAVVESPGAAELGPADTARRVAEYEGRTYYLLRGANDTVCLVDYAPPDNVGTICAPWRGDSLRTLVSHTSFDADGNRFTAILAPDGYEELWVSYADGTDTRESVERNVVLTATNQQTALALMGAGREPLTLRLESPAAMLER